MHPAEIVERMKASAYASRFMDEDALQEAVCAYLDIYVRRDHLIYWSTPNEMPRPRVIYKLLGREMVERIYALLAAALNRRGRKRGAPDIVVQIAHGPALFWECKSANGRLPKEQRGFRDWFRSKGCHWAEIRSIEDARCALEPFVRVRAS